MIADAIAFAAQALVRPFEGYAKALPGGGCAAYPDPASGKEPWTIGYGSTGPDITQHTVWTKDQAEQALMRELALCAKAALAMSPALATQPDARLAAVMSFIYNLGTGRYRISTLKRLIDANRWADAAQEFPKWAYGGGKIMPGLVRRREAERVLFVAAK